MLSRYGSSSRYIFYKSQPHTWGGGRVWLVYDYFYSSKSACENRSKEKKITLNTTDLGMYQGKKLMMPIDSTQKVSLWIYEHAGFRDINLFTYCCKYCAFAQYIYALPFHCYCHRYHRVFSQTDFCKMAVQVFILHWPVIIIVIILASYFDIFKSCSVISGLTCSRKLLACSQPCIALHERLYCFIVYRQCSTLQLPLSQLVLRWLIPRIGLWLFCVMVCITP